MYIHVAILGSFLAMTHAGLLLTKSAGLDNYKGYGGLELGGRLGNDKGYGGLELGGGLGNDKGYGGLELGGGLSNDKGYGGFGGFNQAYGNIGLGDLSKSYGNIELGGGLGNNKGYGAIGIDIGLGKSYGNSGYEGGAGSGGYGKEIVVDVISPPKYEFKYGVNDPKTGDYKEQAESRVDDLTKSEYALAEKDRKIQVSRVIAGKIPVKIAGKY